MEMLIFATVVMVMIFSVIVIYPAFSNVLLDEFIPTTTQILNDTVPSRSTELSTVTNLITQGWVWGPLVMVVGLIVAIYLMTGRREYIPEAY